MPTQTKSKTATAKKTYSQPARNRSKNKRSNNFIQRILSAPQLRYQLTAVLFIMIFAGIGSYLLFKSKAASQYEIPVIVDTNYAIPVGAIFVDSSSGNDANSGLGSTAAVKTITRGLTLVPSGGTVVVRAGTYRESLGTGYGGKPFTLQSYPYEKAWIKGSIVVDGWVSETAGVWRKDGWTAKFCRNTSSTDQSCYLNGLIDPAYPAAGYPDLLFMDEQPIAQVATREAVGPGKFYVDYATSQLFLGTDPTGKTVEGAVHEQAFLSNSTTNAIAIKGLGFKHFASRQAYGARAATVVSSSPKFTFENNTVAWGASAGISINNYPGAVIRGNTSIYNGFNGMLGHKLDNLTLEANRFAFNNRELFWIDNPAGSANAAAGVKLTKSRSAIVADNIFEKNHGEGFWCDLSCHDYKIVRNLARNNAGHGIFYEVSGNAIIGSNVSVGNGNSGIMVSGSNNVKIFNNTLSRNKYNLFIYEDPRGICPGAFDQDLCPSDEERTVLGITWDTANVVVKNNINSNGDGTSIGLYGNSPSLVWVLEGNNPDKYTPTQMVPSMNYNAYHRTSASLPGVTVDWNGQDFNSMDAFKSTGREANGITIDNQSTNPYFVNETACNFNLVNGSPAISAGEALPEDVAAAIGVPSTPVNMGALAGAGLITACAQEPVITEPPASSPVELKSPVYRLRSSAGYSLYTLSQSERDAAISQYGYTSEGTAFMASGISGSNASIVYKLLNSSGDRFYTINTAERDSAIAQYGYALEGTAFYAAQQPGSGLVPVYRLLKGGHHLYTANATEKDSLVSSRGYTYETIAFYAAPAAGTITQPPPIAPDTQPPVVTISSPLNASYIGRNIMVNASGTDNVKLVKMEVLFDGSIKCTTISSPIACNINTRKAARGSHTITTKAYDEAGNVGQTSITVYK